MDQNEIVQLSREFSDCREILTALGEENRQHLILSMMQSGDCSGLRVGEITKRTNLSRPAVSHHLKILKDAGIIRVRKEGTKNYYYFDEKAEGLVKLEKLITHARTMVQSLPDRGGSDD